MADMTGWLSGQVPFAEMPERQLQAFAAEQQVVVGLRIRGINAGAAELELQRRARFPADANHMRR